MIDMLQTKRAVRELDRRMSDGIEVTLLWNVETNDVFVSVDEGEAGGFEFRVPPADALDAFHHPYAYVAHGGSSGAVAA